VDIKVPAVIQKYVDPSNRHDVNWIFSSFSDDAVVRYKGEVDFQG